MTQQEWKSNPKLYNCSTRKDGNQIKKELNYDFFVKKFIKEDPIRDWESVSRCQWLFDWSLTKINDKIETILDIGCKDALFVSNLKNKGYQSLGIEIDERYVKYATELGRPIYQGDATNLSFANDQFDYVFAHHVHGLMPCYLSGLQEMFRVSKKYMICLNQCPGNKKKHYSYIDSPQIYHDFINSINCKIIYNDYLDTGFENEWVLFVKKLGYEDETRKDIDEMILEEIKNEAEIEFKKKKI